jgi:Undecaprenyl-phosphate galactose phosphotransferase WbaP
MRVNRSHALVYTSVQHMKDTSTHSTQSPETSSKVGSISTRTLWQVTLTKRAILAGDVLAIVCAFVLATLIHAGFSAHPLEQAQFWFSTQVASRFWVWGGLASTALGVFLFRFQHYVNRRPFWDELSDILWTLNALALLDMTLVAVTRWNASRMWWLTSWVTLTCLIVLFRSLTRIVLSHFGLWARPTILIGHGKNAREAVSALQSEPHLGYDLQGFVDVGEKSSIALEDQTNSLSQSLGLKPLSIDELKANARQPGIQWVLALDHAQSDLREHWLRQLSQWGAQEICVIPDMRGIPLYGTDMSYFFSHEVAVLRIRNNLKRWPTRLTKRLFDTLVAALLLILLSPLMLYLGFLIRRDGGPAFFSQQRIGKLGKPFKCLKFRSMEMGAENKLNTLIAQNPKLKEQWSKDHKIKDDPRITRIGRFIRKTSLDELPQLINVIKGEMSLVGPRPIVQAELEKYGDDVGYFLMVRPGMTGLWQVSGRNDMDYEQRVYLDTWYVKNWSLWYDLVILFKTVNVVLSRSGAY